MSRFSTSGDGIARTFEGSSLETIRHMVASGIGITVLPTASVPGTQVKDGMLRYVPLSEPVPSRRVVIAWRKSFTRYAVNIVSIKPVNRIYDDLFRSFLRGRWKVF